MNKNTNMTYLINDFPKSSARLAIMQKLMQVGVTMEDAEFMLHCYEIEFALDHSRDIYLNIDKN